MSYVLLQIFIFLRSHLITDNLNIWAMCFLFKKLYHVLISLRLFSNSLLLFSVSGFKLRSFKHLDLNFVHSDQYVPILIILHADIQLDQCYLLKKLFFSILKLQVHVKNQMFIVMWLYFWVFYSIVLLAYLYTNTMKFLLLLVCRTSWHQGWWYLQKFSPCVV